MAYGLKKIPSIDLKPSTSLGVKLPFAAPNVFTPVFTTQEQTKYNLINFLLTDKGERQFNPNFGAGLRSRLFEPIEGTTFDEIKLSLSSQIESYFSSIQIKDLTVTGEPDRSSITISLSYVLLNTGATDTAVINIQTS
ncbi:MAG: GPW/gp25 family protein [bacterium]